MAIKGSCSYSFLFKDMCPEIHIKVYWTCELYEEFHIPPSMHTDVFWGLGPSYEEPANLSYDRKGLSEFDYIYTASQEIGLSQAYDTNPAWATFTFYITFSTKGSHAEDEEYLQQVFNFASALVTYYKMKE